MKPPLAVVDTNVVVSGLITGEPESPTCQVLDGMLAGRFPFLLSLDLLAEYREVLLRPKIQKLHGLREAEVDAVLAALTANGITREPPRSPGKTDSGGDDHLWALLATQPEAVLVTGDRALTDRPPAWAQVLSPRAFCDRHPSRNRR